MIYDNTIVASLGQMSGDLEQQATLCDEAARRHEKYHAHFRLLAAQYRAGIVALDDLARVLGPVSR